MKTNETKSNSKSINSFKGIRIQNETQKVLDKILNSANKKKVGRKIKAYQVMHLALGLVTDLHIQELQNSSLTNEDRKELLRQKYIELRGPISKDDFTGFILSKEASSFFEEARLS